MSRFYLKFIFYFLQIFNFINCQEGFYSIIAPNTIRPNSDYHVAVSIHKNIEPATIKLGIISSSYSNFKTVEVNPYSTELVQFQIGDLKPDRYSLTAEGIIGIVFTNETQLQYDDKQLTVLVQTDKSIYKPNDIVRYRVLILDSNLKPAKNYGSVNIQIKDAGNNRIKHLKNVRLSNNIYSDEFLLSTWPVLGKWTIETEIFGQIHSNNFEVADYVLPKFEIIIESQKHVVYKDEKIQATVKARHSYGKPIKGEVTLSVYPKFFGSIQPFVYDLITRKASQFDGKASFEFDIKNELKFKEDYEHDIFLEAIVEEQLTGRKQNTTITVTIHKDRYVIEPLHIPKYYVPGLPFEATIKVTQYDGSPLKDPISSVTAYLTSFYGSDEIYNKTDYQLDNRGITKLKFTVPKSDTDDHHSIIVQYQDVSTDIGTVERKMTHVDSYIQAEILTESPTVNKEITVAVRSNQRMKYLIYQIVGRGNILLSKTIDVPDSNYHIFKFLSTFAMVPEAQIFVYFIENGNFIFDEQTIEFSMDLWNFIKIDLPSRATPGQDIDITITTKPYSFIGLMAVDQHSVELRQGNDFTPDNLLDELRLYEFDEESHVGPSWSPGYQSGVVTLTNSDYYFERVRPTSSAPTTTQEDSGKMTTIKKTDIGPAHKFEVNTRPPLAGPYAFSRIPKPFWNHPRVHTKYDIANTWLFSNLSSSGSEGRITIHKKLPDTLTTWVISGFSLDPVTGLGVTHTPRILESYRQFYLTTDLPYSVKKGEILSIPFVIFNNMDRDINTEVTLYNTAQEFDFPQMNNEIEEKPRIELYHRQNIQVSTKSSKSLSFLIRPKKIGKITIKATANSPFISDTLETTLLVIPEGKTEFINKGILIDLRSKSEEKLNFTLDIPKNSVQESIHIETSVVGDFLGSAIKNLDKIIQMPLGCGEQNMINFVPNVLILRYLEKMNKLSPAIEKKAKQFLELGYQRQLTYKHSDGSFSPFGNLDKNGSTWLTAYVARWFRHATEYTEIDEEIIKNSLEFLAKIQRSDGSFPEVGYAIDQEYEPETDAISLTAFTMLAFIDNSNSIPEYRNIINKGLDYLVRNLDTTENLFSLAIGTYALQAAGHNTRTNFLYKLDSKAINRDNKKWWNLPIVDFEKKSPWYNKTRSLNNEITAYSALSYLENDLLSDALPILNWLIDQRNMNGGFITTQDTVIGLQAIIKFAEQLPQRGTNIQVVFEYGTGMDTRMNVNDENSIVLQSYMLPSTIRNVTITASGRGIALAQLSYKYNVNVTGAWPRFSLDPQVNRISHSNYLHLSICTSFVSVSGERNRSNMAVMEVELPSGFTVDIDTLPSLEAHERIKKVETQKRNTIVFIYFDYLDRREICPTLDAHKTHKVTKHKPASVIIYDYYDNARKARMFYNAPKSTVCDICEGSECDNSCTVRADERKSLKDGENGNNNDGRNANNSSSYHRLHNVILIFCIFGIPLRLFNTLL